MESGIEVLAVGGRGRRNRKWPDDVKARVVAETLKPGASVNEVARRHGLPANHVSSWRTLARQGRLVLPAPEDPLEFAALLVGPSEHGSLTASDGPGQSEPGRPEIIAGAVVIRLEAGATPDRIASVVRALAAHP